MRTTAFLVSEREPNSNFTETVRAVNYSFLYYQNDQLVLWIAPTSPAFRDTTAFPHTIAPGAGVTIVVDPERGYVVRSAGGQVNLPDFVPTTSYTKAAWVKLADNGNSLLFSTAVNNNEFMFFSGGNLGIAHNGTGGFGVPYPAGEWHHVLVTYDDDSHLGVLYVDGLEAARGELGSRPLAEIKALGFNGLGFSGDVSDMRIWSRALSAREARSVYLASQ